MAASDRVCGPYPGAGSGGFLVRKMLCIKREQTSTPKTTRVGFKLNKKHGKRMGPFFGCPHNQDFGKAPNRVAARLCVTVGVEFVLSCFGMIFFCIRSALAGCGDRILVGP